MRNKKPSAIDTHRLQTMSQPVHRTISMFNTRKVVVVGVVVYIVSIAKRYFQTT